MVMVETLRERTERSTSGMIARMVAIPALVGARALGVVANAGSAQESSPVAGTLQTAGIFG